MFFHIVKSSSKAKLSFFQTKSIKKHCEELRRATIFLPSFSSPGNVLFAVFTNAVVNLTSVFRQIEQGLESKSNLGKGVNVIIDVYFQD